MTYYIQDQNSCIAKVPAVQNTDPSYHPTTACLRY